MTLTESIRAAAKNWVDNLPPAVYDEAEALFPGHLISRAINLIMWNFGDSPLLRSPEVLVAASDRELMMIKNVGKKTVPVLRFLASAAISTSNAGAAEPSAGVPDLSALRAALVEWARTRDAFQTRSSDPEVFGAYIRAKDNLRDAIPAAWLEGE